jgi:MYXO-CTERM domain-containing protein
LLTYWNDETSARDGSDPFALRALRGAGAPADGGVAGLSGGGGAHADGGVTTTSSGGGCGCAVQPTDRAPAILTVFAALLGLSRVRRRPRRQRRS